MNSSIPVNRFWFLITCAVFVFGLNAQEVPPDMKNISRFEDDRILLHFIHNLDVDGKRLPSTDPSLDPSLMTLVIIKNSQTYIFRDGHDDKREISSRMADFNRNLGMYRSRQAFLKEFRDIQEEKKRWDSQSPEFKKGVDNSDRLYHSLFLKKDPIYKDIDKDIKKATADEYRFRKFQGIGSPSYKSALEKLESLHNERTARKSYLIQSLAQEESNPSSSVPLTQEDSPNATVPTENRSMTPLPTASNPGNWNDMNFFQQKIDGNWDYASYSRSPRTVDWETRDRESETKVNEKYGKAADTMVDRLLSKHAEKMIYIYNRKGEVGARSIIENLGPGNGKRLILQTNDHIRYVLEDRDGDGKAETWEISNTSIPFRYFKDSANIVSIRGCNIEKICKHFQNLISELESGTTMSLGDVKQYGKGADKLLGNEDELLRDWDDLIRETFR